MNKYLHRLLVLLIVGVVMVGFLGPQKRAAGGTHGEARGATGATGQAEIGTETVATNLALTVAANANAAAQVQAAVGVETSWENDSCHGDCTSCADSRPTDKPKE